MNLSLFILLSSFIASVFAGGIRGAYERMFVWYAYRAETDYLTLKGLDQTSRVICQGATSKDPLTFNKFIEYTNRDNKNTPGIVYNVASDGQPPIDKTAFALEVYTDKNLMPETWPSASRIARSRGGGYEDMLVTVGERVMKIQNDPQVRGTGGFEPNEWILDDLAKSIESLKKAFDARQIDFENFRMKALRSQFPSLKIEGDEVRVAGDLKGEVFSYVKTIDANPNEKSVGPKIATFMINNYFGDTTWNDGFEKTEGEVRKAHKVALESVRRAKAIVTWNGVCDR